MRKDIKRAASLIETQASEAVGEECAALEVQAEEALRRRASSRARRTLQPSDENNAEGSAIEVTREPFATDGEPTLFGSLAGQTPLPLERDQSYMRDYFMHSPSVIVAVDEEMRLCDLNPSACTRLGISLEEACRFTCKDVLKCRNMNSTLLCGTSNCPLVHSAKRGETISASELFLGARAGFEAEYSVNVGPTRVNGRAGAVFVARDLSRLKVAHQVRANFVSMVSHELRTPLNSIYGFIDLLMQGHMGALNDEQRLYLGYTQEGVQQLMTIVEDILFMTRSDSGQFEIKPQKTNSRVLAKQVVTSLKMQAKKAAVILDKDIPEIAPLIYADPQRMQQVLNNLVTNAIKFTPPHGTVIIRVRRHPEQEDKVLFAVVDTGDGIPPEDQPHIFERFYQSNHAMQSKMGGYGLGLSIARLIVEQHGGEISFESVPGQGTTFYFTTPLYTGQDGRLV